MPNIICDKATLVQLASDTINGAPNPFQDTIMFNLLTSGGGWREAEIKHHRQIQRQGGKKLRGRLFVSPDLKMRDLPIETMIAAATVFTDAEFEVIGYQAYITILDADYNRTVKFYLPNSRLLDEAGEKLALPEGKVSWAEWKTGGHFHRTIADENGLDVHYIPAKSGNDGKWIAATKLLKYVTDDAGVVNAYPLPVAPDAGGA